MPRRYAPHELVETFSKLSSLPEVYLRIRDAVESPDSSVDEVAKLIATDPAITARLLRAVNSAMYALSRRVDTVSKAVNVLGMQQVHDIILASSVTTTFAGMSAGLMDVRRFWSTSLLCALAARGLGKKAGLVDSERLFLVGLLSRVGHLVMYDKIPQLAAVALSHANSTQQPLFMVERQLIGCDYAAVGGELLARWQLPETIVGMILDHVEPEHAQSCAIGAAIVHLASIIATTGGARSGKIDPHTLNNYLWEATGLKPEVLADMERVVRTEFSAAAEAFIPALANAA